MALWSLLFTSHRLGIDSMLIFGDSLVTINWANKKFDLQSIPLVHWCRRIEDLIPQFSDISFHHIFREQNGDADYLSKEALCGIEGILIVDEYIDGVLSFNGSLQIFEI